MKRGLKAIAVQNPLSSLADDVTATHRVIGMQEGPVLLVGVSSLPKGPSAMVKPVAVGSVALAPVAIRRAIRGLNDAASSDRSSASDRITASDLPGVSRAIWTAPREAGRTRRACGKRTP